jgi:hypothetical protein
MKTAKMIRAYESDNNVDTGYASRDRGDRRWYVQYDRPAHTFTARPSDLPLTIGPCAAVGYTAYSIFGWVGSEREARAFLKACGAVTIVTAKMSFAIVA